MAYNTQDELCYDVFFDGLGKKVTVMREDDMKPLYEATKKPEGIAENESFAAIVGRMFMDVLDAEKARKITTKPAPKADIMPKEAGLKISDVNVKKIESPFVPGSLKPIDIKVVEGGNIAKTLKEMGNARKLTVNGNGDVIGGTVLGTGFPFAMKKMPDNVKRHYDIVMGLNELYAKKNADYGDSFHDTYLEEGMAMARIRLSDKLGRFKSLTKSGQQHVKDENVRDTLLDLANYAIMTVIEMDREEARV